MLLAGIPYNLTSLGHGFLLRFVDQEKTRLCATTKSPWPASETLGLGFRLTQEITVDSDALIITKIEKAMQMGSTVRAHFCPDKRVRVKIVTPSEDSSEEALSSVSRGNLTHFYTASNLTISNPVACSDAMVFGVSTPRRMSILTNHMHSVLAWL